jgi:NADH-quinone oxidoreductase subunit A
VPVSDFLRSYLTVALFGALAVGLVGAFIGLSSLVRPTRPQQQKYINYESGVDPVGTGWAQANIRYYVFALLFVMFDVEAVFIFPWATRLEAYGLFGLIEMFIFIFILLLGLLYAWRKGVLRWI